MKPLFRAAILSLAVAALPACSLGSLLGGGGKGPPTLLTLNSEAPAPGEFERSAAAGAAVTINAPAVPASLRTNRIAVAVTPTEVAYIKDAQWADMPARLFQDLLAETVRRTTGRVVLDPRQSSLDPGLVVGGELQRFGFDATEQAVVVVYDASLATPGGTRVETRRFEARAPSDGTAATAGPALNRAANEVARKVAGWIAR